MPIIGDDENPDAYQKKVNCLVCDRVIKKACVREVRIELLLDGGGSAPDVELEHFFCSVGCAKEAAKMIAAEIQSPNMEDPTFPAYLPFRGKIESHQIHFMQAGPASYDSDASPVRTAV